MNRVEVAIQDSRCVLVFGSKVLAEADVLGELRRRPGIPATTLGGDLPSPCVALNADTMAHALAKEGGVICLVEADSIDAQGIQTLATLVQAAPSKPRLVVVGRAFNPFLLPAPLRLLKFEHEKKRAREFLQTLPIPVAPAPVAVVVEEPKKKAGGAPRASFSGREDELATLTGMLDAGGPIVVQGPAGIGKRWLVEKALQGRPQKRVPDFYVGWGSEADSLYARIAMIASEAGDNRLAEALRSPATRPVPAELAALAVASLAAAPETTLVIDRFEHVLRRDGTFHRESRFEMLLRALLLGGYATRLVFLSTIRPRFYRETEGAGLKLIELAGLKGRELHEIFDAFRVEDFPREHFGEIHNRIHGHPLAARLFAVAVREVEDRDELLESKKFMTMSGPGDLEVIRRRIQKAVDKLPEEERRALSALAHFRLPLTVADCDHVGVDRKTRLALLAKGLLDPRPEDNNSEKTFHVHPLVAGALGHRETSDYALLELLADHYAQKAEKSESHVRLAHAHEANRLYFEAHRIRNRYRMPYPDHDPSLESIRGMVRSKKPRFDLAEQRIIETLNLDPANTEVALMQAELAVATKQDAGPVYTRIAELAPTPEVFHQEASFYQLKSSGRGKAAAALEKGAAVFPDNARLRRRLAGIYVDQNKLADAVRVLDEAMHLEPMMPDTYGLLGEINLLRGPDYYDQAEAALGEARRLDPENGLHMARLGALVFERGLDDAARLAQAQELLDLAVQADQKNYLAHLYLARVLLAVDGDLERADWLLKKAMKLDERASAPLVERARIAVKRQAWADADQLSEKAIRMEPGSAEGFLVRGEMCAAQGNIFVALSEFQRALERSTPGTKGRNRADDAIAKCKALIESGAAGEMLKLAEAAGIPVVEPRTDAARREPGKTTRRRRGKGEGDERPAKAVAHAPGEDTLVEAGATASDVDGVRERAKDALHGRNPDEVDAHAGDETPGEPSDVTEPDDAPGADAGGESGDVVVSDAGDPLTEGVAADEDAAGEEA